MSTEVLDRLQAVMPAPQVPASGARPWEAVTSELGLTFSTSVRQLIELYGRGSIGGELGLQDPRDEGFSSFVRASTTTYPEDQAPLPMFPDASSSLLPIAGNGNADDVFLIVRDGVAQDDSVWIGNIKARLWLEQPGPLAAFLLRVVTGDDLDALFDLFGDWAWRLAPEFTAQ